MYLVAIAASMLVLPLLSIAIEMLVVGVANPAIVAAKWFVFWAIGGRLMLAGVHQVLKPSFTTSILRIVDSRAEKLVTEIGFGNISIGVCAILSALLPSWVAPAGVAGALYLSLAGIGHLRDDNRSFNQNIAMVSEFLGAGVVTACLLMAHF